MASLAEIQAIVQRIHDDLPLLVQRSQITPQQVVVGEGLSDISKRLGLVQAGEFRSGNGIEPGLGFSGVRIGYPPFLYSGELWNIAGIEDDVIQAGLRASDGKFIAGGGDVTIDADGIQLVSGNGDNNMIRWINPSTSDVEARIKVESGSEDMTIDPDGDLKVQAALYTTAATNPLVGIAERSSAPAYEDGFALFYYLDTGTLRVRHKQSATEKETTIVNATGGYDAPSGSTSTFDGAVTINGSNGNADVIIKGQTDSQLVVVDASTNNVGIGTNPSVSYKLEVAGAMNVSGLIYEGGVSIDTMFAAAATGVTNGNSHDHVGGDGGTISYNNLSNRPWIVVTKTADESVQNNTLQNDNELTFAMAANTKYRIRGRIWYTTPAAADFKYRFNYGAGATPTISWLKHKYTAPLAVAETEQAIEIANPTTTISVLSAGAVTDPGYIEFEALVHKENAAHNFTLQWAQNTTTASNTTVKAGSYLEYQEA